MNSGVSNISARLKSLKDALDVASLGERMQLFQWLRENPPMHICDNQLKLAMWDALCQDEINHLLAKSISR
ncbi:MAG: hypothetical protein GTN99_02825 [Candidatus Dadabacteria bacterium]|nr:hypothetical protein [Candidatus Dadabacteria bacterium]